MAENLAHPEFSSFERQTGNLFGKKVLQKSNLGKLGNSWSDLLQVRVQQIKSLWTPGRIGKRGNFPSPMGSLGVVPPLGTNLDFAESSLDPSQGKTGKFCQSQGSEATFQGNSSTPSGFQGLLSTATESTSSEVSPPPSQGGKRPEKCSFLPLVEPREFSGGNSHAAGDSSEFVLGFAPPEPLSATSGSCLVSGANTRTFSLTPTSTSEGVPPPLAALTPSESLPKFTPETLALFQGSLCPLGNTAKGLPSSGELFREPRLSGGPFWTPPSQLEDAPTLHGQHDGRTPPPPSWSLHLKPALNFSDRV